MRALAPLTSQEQDRCGEHHGDCNAKFFGRQCFLHPLCTQPITRRNLMELARERCATRPHLLQELKKGLSQWEASARLLITDKSSEISDPMFWNGDEDFIRNRPM
jgi:hypothetical protein